MRKIGSHDALKVLGLEKTAISTRTWNRALDAMGRQFGHLPANRAARDAIVNANTGPGWRDLGDYVLGTKPPVKARTLSVPMMGPQPTGSLPTNPNRVPKKSVMVGGDDVGNAKRRADDAAYNARLSKAPIKKIQDTVQNHINDRYDDFPSRRDDVFDAFNPVRPDAAMPSRRKKP